MVSRKKSRPIDLSDDDVQRDADELAEAMVENLPNQPEGQLEPFEIYSQRMKVKFYSESNNFRERFCKGYHALLSELAKQNPHTNN